MSNIVSLFGAGQSQRINPNSWIRRILIKFERAQVVTAMQARFLSLDFFREYSAELSWVYIRVGQSLDSAKRLAAGYPDHIAVPDLQLQDRHCRPAKGKAIRLATGCAGAERHLRR